MSRSVERDTETFVHIVEHHSLVMGRWKLRGGRDDADALDLAAAQHTVDEVYQCLVGFAISLGVAVHAMPWRKQRVGARQHGGMHGLRVWRECNATLNARVCREKILRPGCRSMRCARKAPEQRLGLVRRWQSGHNHRGRADGRNVRTSATPVLLFFPP